MRTAIVNKQRNPELFQVLHHARTQGTKYEGCNITQYEEFTKAGETIGVFTLSETVDEAL